MFKRISVFQATVFAVFAAFFVVVVYRNFSITTHDGMELKKHRLVLIVLDALRHDYLEVARDKQIDLPSLNRLYKNGARSMKVQPAFPSVTMPNHQTLVTGLHTPYHGITHNTFNDSSMGYERFAMGNQTALNEARWYSGYPDPIWVSCEKNPHCKSASMLWPNTDAVFNGYRPSRFVSQYISLNQSPKVHYPYTRRVDELIDWLRDDLIDFGLLYFDEPDTISHENGPFHSKTLDKLKEMDGYIGRFIEGLEKIDLLRTTDIILTGDHGMTELSAEKVIQIDEKVPPSIYRSTYSSPVGIIYPNEGKFEEVLSLYQTASPHIKVYKREEVPAHLHYSDNPRRISPIVTVVDLGWTVNSSHYISQLDKGGHGYSPLEDDMKTTLLAMGPSFRQVVINESSHVDLYPLMAHLLGIRSNPHNGSFSRISTILTDQARVWRPIEGRWTFNRIVLFVYVVFSLQVASSLALLLALCCSSRRRSQFRPKKVAACDHEQSMALISSE